MKTNSDRSPAAGPEQERLAKILSAGLCASETAGCLDEESIASVVDGSVSPDRRDQLLKHISACDTCYETYLLTAELLNEESSALTADMLTTEEHSRNGNRRRSFFPAKAAALAASVLIAAVSVYVFYTSSSVPGTAEQLLKTAADETAVTKPAPEPVPAGGDDSDGKSKSPNMIGEGKMDRGVDIREKAESEREQPLEEQEKENRKMGFTPKRGKQKSVLPGDKKAAAPHPEFKQTPEQARNRHLKASSTDKISPKKKTSQMPMTQAMAAAETSTEKFDDKPQAGQQRIKPVDIESDFAGTVSSLPLVQIRQLKKRLQSSSAYIPGNELRRFFQESLAIAGQVRSLAGGDPETGSEDQNIQDFVAIARSAPPVFRVSRDKRGISLSLNMDYFLSRSIPGSVDFQFYSLARAGWSGDGGTWSQGQRLSESASIGPAGGKSLRQSKNETGLSRGAKQRQLQQWNVLLPKLPPEYRQIAENTVKYLERK